MMVNYFHHAYPVPEDRQAPYRVTTRLSQSPWHTENRLLHSPFVAMMLRAASPQANIVLLIDTSSPMQPNDWMPLLQQGFSLFTRQLCNDRRGGRRMYTGQARVGLEPTVVRDKHKIVKASEPLRADDACFIGARHRVTAI